MAEVSKPVLVTGCSSGIGHATAAHLADRGWTVYATARRTESIEDLAQKGCNTLALDVTDEASMRSAVEAVEAAEGAVGGPRHRLGTSRARPARARHRSHVGPLDGRAVPAPAPGRRLIQPGGYLKPPASRAQS